MSEAAYRHSHDVRRRCQSCESRKARFSYRGQVKADRNHLLCFECFRAERERRRARLLADVPSAEPISVELTDRQGRVSVADTMPSSAGSGERRERVECLTRIESVATSEQSERLERFGRLDVRQVEHRRRMLAHLTSARRA